MPSSTQDIPITSVIKAACIVALWAMIGLNVTGQPWMHLLFIPALIGVHYAPLVAATLLTMAAYFAAIFVFGQDPSKSPVALVVICSALPTAMLLGLFFQTLRSPYFDDIQAKSFRRRVAAVARPFCITSAVVLWILLVSRTYRLEIVMPLAATLFFGAAALPTLAKKRAGLKTRLANLALVLFSVLFGLAVIEIGARLLVPASGPRTGLWIPNAKYIFDIRPSIDVTLDHKVGPDEIKSVKAHISSQGLRDVEFGPKKPNEYRILMLGDSFTFGQTVDVPDTIPSRLDSLLSESKLPRDIVTINFGIPATGPWQQRGLLEERGFALEPDLVLHQLFLGNDIRDTLARTGELPRAFDSEWQSELLRLRLLAARRIMAEQWLADHSRAYSLFRSSMGRATITEFLAEDCRLFPILLFNRLPQTEQRSPSIEIDLVDWYPELQKAMDEIIETVAELKKECDARGIGYVVYAIPQADEIVENWFEPIRQNEVLKYDLTKSNAILTEELKRKGVPLVPLFDEMRAHPDPESLFLEYDRHTTIAGNEFIVERIRDYLLQQYFPKHPIDASKE